MLRIKHIFVILVIGIISISTFSSFAQTEETISVTTSKKSYNEGDTIVIFGEVSSIELDTLVTIQIFHEGNLVDIVQSTVAQDGKYTHTMLAEGPLWQKDGTYIIRASYGANYMVETSFEYTTKLSVNDTDKDGIPNDSDECPTQAETMNGFEDTDGCPDVVPVQDTDKDGIPNDVDKCPTQPENINGFEDLDGCPDVIPLKDTDGDGIADSLDKCPTQVETVNGFEDLDGCPDTPSTPSPTPSPSNGRVNIAQGSSTPGCEETNSCYTPYQLRVGRGSTVTWFNADTAAHTVTSGTPDGGPDGEFDSSLFMAGTTFSHRFDRDGTYPYVCMVHPWMIGYVIVERGGAILSPEQTPTSGDKTPPKILQPNDIEVDADEYNGARVTFEVLAIDDRDEMIRPSCAPSSGSFFSVGNTNVVCSAMDKSGNRAQQVSF
ncbi:MAG: thrombospondin type 3 repeat-containing protein, partial [Nitrosopumilaceae archaeon]